MYPDGEYSQEVRSRAGRQGKAPPQSNSQPLFPYPHSQPSSVETRIPHSATKEQCFVRDFLAVMITRAVIGTLAVDLLHTSPPFMSGTHAYGSVLHVPHTPQLRTRAEDKKTVDTTNVFDKQSAPKRLHEGELLFELAGEHQRACEAVVVRAGVMLLQNFLTSHMTCSTWEHQRTIFRYRGVCRTNRQCRKPVRFT